METENTLGQDILDKIAEVQSKLDYWQNLSDPKYDWLKAPKIQEYQTMIARLQANYDSWLEAKASEEVPQ